MSFETYCPACSKRFPDGTVVCPEDGSPLLRVPEEDLVGKTVDRRYRISEVIGQGGMGIVYRAEHQMLQREVALKVVRRDVVQDETAVKRFLTEARAIAALKNAHTVTIYDSGVTEDGALYYTMELLTGQPLSRLLRREGAVGCRRAADLIGQVCESLAEAHAMGILHRDIKPDNIFLVREKGKEFAKLVDFGIAKVLGDSSDGPMTRTGMLVGTPRYLSPEQVGGEPVGPTTDLYALAVVLYELLTGTPPFSGETPAQIMMMHAQETPEPILERNPGAKIPGALDKFIRSALEKDPRKRFQTAHEFRQALTAAVVDAGTDLAEVAPSGVDSYAAAVVGTANTEIDVAQQVLDGNSGNDETMAAPGIPERTVTSPLESMESAASHQSSPATGDDTAPAVSVPTEQVQLESTAGYDQVGSPVVARGRTPLWLLLLGGLGLLVIVPWATGLFGPGEVDQIVQDPPVHVEVQLAAPAGVVEAEDVVNEGPRHEASDAPVSAPLADVHLPVPDAHEFDSLGRTEADLAPGDSQSLDIATGVDAVSSPDQVIEVLDENPSADVASSPAPPDKIRGKRSGSGKPPHARKPARKKPEEEHIKEPAKDDWFDDVEKLPTK